GKERDSESGLDEFGARYYGSSLGRFMTPDWAAKPITVPYAVFGDPQTLNLYGYVENSPVDRVDADGHCGGGANEGGTPCDNVRVTAEVQQKPEFQKNVNLPPGSTGGSKGDSMKKVTGEGGKLTLT